MNHNANMKRLFAVFAVLALSSAAEANGVRYVSSRGSDANACTLSAPCRTLQRGVAVTPAGGEVRILDSGTYGNGVMIRKTITLSADNETVMLHGPVTIDGLAAVTLRGLSLNGRDTVGTGIRILNANAVHIDDCTIEHFAGNGIVAAGSGMDLFVTDSVSRENGEHGLHVTSTTTVRVAIDNSRFENNRGTGILGEGVDGSVTRTIASGNQNGIWWAGSLDVVSSMAANNSGGGYVVAAGRMHLESSVARGNGFVGLQVRSAGSVASISNFTATGNATGIMNEGTVLTRQNNTLDGNTTGVFGAQPTPLPPI